MCDLCKNIVNEKDIEKIDYWERYGAIIYDPENDVYGIYIQQDDDYYSGWAFDIKYCPNCGRKLNDS